MNIFRISGVRIEGVSACVPDNFVDNETVLRELYGDDAKKIVESTGIKARCVAKAGTSSSDLCVACAEDLLANTHTKPEEIAAVIFVTFTPDRLLPFNAAIVQEKLSLPREIPAFDINLACSGYIYGLYVAALFAKSLGKKVLLLDGDIQTAYMSGQDKATVPVMADAGTATLLSSCDSDSDLDSEWKFAFLTDGSGREFLTIPAGGSENPFEARHLEIHDDRRDVDIYMDGFAVFKFVASDVSKWLGKILAETRDEIDYFVPHQANMFMIRKLAKKLNIPWEKTWKSGDELGNSGSATVPVTIAKNAREFLQRDGKILVSSFGGGFSAGAGIINLASSAYYKLFRFSKI